jgi:hypothetical protein
MLYQVDAKYAMNTKATAVLAQNISTCNHHCWMMCADLPADSSATWQEQ